MQWKLLSPMGYSAVDSLKHFLCISLNIKKTSEAYSIRMPFIVNTSDDLCQKSIVAAQRALWTVHVHLLFTLCGVSFGTVNFCYVYI